MQGIEYRDLIIYLAFPAFYNIIYIPIFIAVIMGSDKTYRIGEVAKLLNVNTSVLRFWQTRFSQIEPITINGQRLYTEENIVLLKKIRHLLYDQCLTIEGVKKILNKPQESYVNIKQPINKSKTDNKLDILKTIHKELINLRDFLDNSKTYKNPQNNE